MSVRTPGAEKDEDHGGHEPANQEDFVLHSLHGGADKDGLIEDGLDVHPGRGGGADLRETGQDSIDDVHCRGVAKFQDRDHHGVLSIEARDVCRDRFSIADVGDVAQQHGASAHRAQRDVEKRLDGLRAGVDLDWQLAATFAQRAGWQGQVLLADDGADFGGGHVEGVQGLGVEVDHDLPGRAAVGKRDAHAGNALELSTERQARVVEKLPAGHRVRRHPELNDGHARRARADDERRRGALRHAAENGLRDAGCL
jgi:hypothetical protein